MSVSSHQIHPVFVGEMSGIDITRPLSRDEVAAVEAGMDRYAVLVFHDQHVTDEQQMAFTLNLADDAPRAPLRRESAARHAAHHGCGHRAHRGPGRGGGVATALRGYAG